MNLPSQLEQALEPRVASSLMDVLIRAGLILVMAMLCYQIFSPFLTLMVWALILAVTIYPLHQALARKIGGKQGLAATLLVVVGVVLIVAPTAMLMSSLGDAEWPATVLALQAHAVTVRRRMAPPPAAAKLHVTVSDHGVFCPTPQKGIFQDSPCLTLRG